VTATSDQEAAARELATESDDREPSAEPSGVNYVAEPSGAEVRARCVTLSISLGDAKSSLGDVGLEGAAEGRSGGGWCW
jgi:hypothetical protein